MSSFIEDALLAALPSMMAPFVEQQLTIHTGADGDEREVKIIIDSSLQPTGDYGERTERVTTIETAATDGAAVGDTWTVSVKPTDEDPYPDPIVWRADQLMDDDGLVRKFLARRVE